MKHGRNTVGLDFARDQAMRRAATAMLGAAIQADRLTLKAAEMEIILRRWASFGFQVTATSASLGLTYAALSYRLDRLREEVSLEAWDHLTKLITAGGDIAAALVPAKDLEAIRHDSHDD